MSLILDALQRSQEQSVDTTKTLAVAPAPARRPNSRRGLLLGILVGVLASMLLWLLVSAFLEYPPTAIEGTSKLAGSTELSVPAISNPSNVATAQRSAKDGPEFSSDTKTLTGSQAPLAPQPMGLELSQQASSALPTGLGNAQRSALPSIDRSRRSEVAALYQGLESNRPATEIEQRPVTDGDSASPQASQSDDQVIDIEALLRKAQAELGETPLSPHPAPLIERLSQQQKNRIPTLIYSEHDWSADKPSVVINGQRLAVGGRLNNLTVVDVLADSVVVRWDGTEFRLRALNSWVNL